MADEIVVTSGSGSSAARVPVPEGQYQAVCVDVIDVGETVEQYQNKPPKLAHKIVIVWQLAEDNPETGRPYEVSREFTLSFGEKANLRKVLGNWRGKSYTDEEADKGIPLHKLAGVNALLTVEHKTSGAGRKYAVVKDSLTPLPRQMGRMEPRDYTRAEFWQERKGEYAAAAAVFKAKHAPKVPDAALAGALADDADDLPF
jgi:hypothetical protein